LYRIESIRFRESIKPVLKYSGSVDMMKLEDKDKRILTIQVTNETNSLALKISRIAKQSDKPNQIYIPMGLSDKCDHLINGDKPLLYHFLIDNPMDNWVIFSLSYQDVAGTRYKQAVLCICDSFGIDINTFMPEIIEDFDNYKVNNPRKPKNQLLTLAKPQPPQAAAVLAPRSAASRKKQKIRHEYKLNTNKYFGCKVK